MTCVAVRPQRGVGHAFLLGVLTVCMGGRVLGRPLGAPPPSITGRAEAQQAVPADVWADRASVGSAPRPRRAVRPDRPTVGAERVTGGDAERTGRGPPHPRGARLASPGALFIPPKWV